jgi:hypothetical protein
VAGAHPVALRYTSLSTAEGFFSVLKHSNYYQVLCSALIPLTALFFVERVSVTGSPRGDPRERVVAKNFVF